MFGGEGLTEVHFGLRLFEGCERTRSNRFPARNGIHSCSNSTNYSVEPKRCSDILPLRWLASVCAISITGPNSAPVPARSDGSRACNWERSSACGSEGRARSSPLRLQLPCQRRPGQLARQQRLTQPAHRPGTELPQSNSHASRYTGTTTSVLSTRK